MNNYFCQKTEREVSKKTLTNRERILSKTHTSSEKIEGAAVKCWQRAYMSRGLFIKLSHTPQHMRALVGREQLDVRAKRFHRKRIPGKQKTPTTIES